MKRKPMMSHKSSGFLSNTNISTVWMLCDNQSNVAVMSYSFHSASVQPCYYSYFYFFCPELHRQLQQTRTDWVRRGRTHFWRHMPSYARVRATMLQRLTAAINSCREHLEEHCGWNGGQGTKSLFSCISNKNKLLPRVFMIWQNVESPHFFLSN